MRSEGTDRSGKLDGLYTEWHQNGQKGAEATCRNGQDVPGSWKTWDETGNPIQ